MDVLSGGVPRAGHPAFRPEDLPPAWDAAGATWVEARRGLYVPTAGGAAAPAAPAPDPEQLRLLERAFAEADADGDGALRAGELAALLRGLGLEPTDADVGLVLGELAEPRSGLVRRAALLGYVRHGGRPPGAGAGGPGRGSARAAAARRRVDSLYRVYSIEQYSMAAALAELEGAGTGGGAAAEALKARLAAGGAAELAASSSAGAAGDDGDEAAADAASDAPAEKAAAAAGVPRKKTAGFALAEAIPEEGAPPPGAPPRRGSGASEGTLEALGTLDAPMSPPAGAGDSAGGGGRRAFAAAPSPRRDPDAAPPRRGLGRRFMRAAGLDAGSGALRATPGAGRQFAVLASRAGVKWARNWSSMFANLLLLAFAALVCGAVHGTGGAAGDVRGQAALVMLTMGVTAAATALPVFGRDRVVFWRERASGVGVLPYWGAATALHLVDCALQPLVFLAVYQSMTLPAIPFATHYALGLLVTFWCASAGCLMSVLVGSQANALVAAVAVVMVAGGFINGVSPNFRELAPGLKAATALSYNRWAIEAVAIAAYEHYPRHLWPLARAMLNVAGYCGLDQSGVPSVARIGTAGGGAL
jgi:hypothetical protein